MHIEVLFRSSSILAASVVATLAIACGSPDHATHSTGSAASSAARSAAPLPSAVPASAPSTALATSSSASGVVEASISSQIAFTGTREETERFIGYYNEIHLNPEQERVKVEALSAIPAPCCDENSLATCCCPCNMAKAAWGLSAWLITEKGQGVEGVRQAANAWLAAANPSGFTGDACSKGGCARPIHENGCGGMDAGKVL